MPRVTVLIPTFNRRPLLALTLDSLRAQTYDDFEVIVCDDCSTDGTWDYLQSLGWDRLRVVRNEQNLNLPGSMTRLFSLAEGEYVGMQHDHDLYDPRFLERMVALMDAYPTAGMGCCAVYMRTEAGETVQNAWTADFDLAAHDRLIPGQDLLWLLATKTYTPIAAMSTIYRRRAVEKAGGYRPDWYLAADEDLYRRVATVSDLVFCPERLLESRERPRDRSRILGMWKMLYTIFDFREDTVRHYLKPPLPMRIALLMRLRVLFLVAWLRESLSLWLNGRAGEMDEALTFRSTRTGLPPLPSGRRRLASLWLQGLRLTAKAGPRVQAVRERARTRSHA